MISVDDRRPETLSFFIGNDLSSKKRPIISRCGFSPFSFSNCLDNFVEKKKKASFVVRRTSRWYTEERWFIERESNVDKELDGTSMVGMEGRSKEEKNGDTILADPRSDDTPSQL